MMHTVLMRAFAALTIFTATASWAAETGPIGLFGVRLQGASRAMVRQAFKSTGLAVTREDDRYWVDIYDARAVLEGASDLKMGYVAATGQFAYAEYTFPSFMDTRQVIKIIDMVSIKYGRPSSRAGNPDLGGVSAKWQMPQGMQIQVARGWPQTTTVLQIKDTAALGQMQAEQAANERAEDNRKAKAQSRAF